MDALRSCYSDQITISDDPAVPPQNITWYFVPDGTPVLGVPTAFCSSNYDQDKLTDPAMLGELRQADRRYYNGASPWNYLGKCNIGTPQQWAEGLTLADWNAPAPPIPACCQKPVPTIWYLRPDKPIVQKNLPPIWFGNWGTLPPTMVCNLLDTERGSSPFSQSTLFNSAPFFPIGWNAAVAQYQTAAFPNTTIPMNYWTVGLAASGLPLQGTEWSIQAWLTRVDANGVGQQNLFGRVQFDPVLNAPEGTLTWILTQLVPDVPFNLGDSLILTIGFNVGFASVPLAFAGTFLAAGSDSFIQGTVPISSPASYLMVGIPSGYVLLETGFFLQLESGDMLVLEQPF